MTMPSIAARIPTPAKSGISPSGPTVLNASADRAAASSECAADYGCERDYGRPASELMRDPEFVERYVVDLALGLKAAIMLLNPARIVIGGGIAKAGDRLFIPLREELARQITPGRARASTWFPPSSATTAFLYGAMALAQ